MSTVPPGISSHSGVGIIAAGNGTSPVKPTEIKLISHSNLFYWWPVWLLAFFFAAWTYIENHRLLITPARSEYKKIGDGVYQINTNPNPKDSKELAATTKSLEDAVKLTVANSGGEKIEGVRPRVSEQSWLGSLFGVVLVLTIVITNVPLRGLWAFIIVLLIILTAVFITLFKVWDDIFESIGNLHIYLNYSGYLFIGLAIFVIWSLSTFVFDRRSYVIFQAGRIMVCEHVGAAVQMYPSMGVAMEKQRDDLFRHYILGFGSGDLILRMSAGERKEIRIPNVLGIGWRIRSVEELLGSMTVKVG